MTIEEAIKRAREILNGISVPVGMTEAIAFPIHQAVNLLDAVMEAYAEEDRQNESEEVSENV